MFVGTGGIARADVALDADGVVVGEPALQPFGGIGLAHSVAVQRIACPADVLVASAQLIDVTLAGKLLLHPVPYLAHGYLIVIHGKDFRFLAVECVGVVAQRTASGGILHRPVIVSDAQNAAVMVVSLMKGFQVSLLVGHPLHPEDDAQSFTRQGDVCQQPVRVVLQPFQHPRHFVLGLLVDIDQGVAGEEGYILVRPGAVEHHGRGESRALAALDFACIVLESLRQEVAVLFGVVFQSSVGSEQAIHFRQGNESRRLVHGELREE